DGAATGLGERAERLVHRPFSRAHWARGPVTAHGPASCPGTLPGRQCSSRLTLVATGAQVQAPSAQEAAGAQRRPTRRWVLTSLSRAIWKNEERRTKRATSIRISPAATMPISDQRQLHSARLNDRTKTQPRKPAAPSGSTPTVTKSQGLPVMRRR